MLIPQLVGASTLAFGQQPSDTATGETIVPAITVKVEDPSGNVVAGDASNVTIAISGNPGGATLGGTLTVAAVNGIATFSDLSINNVGSGYTLIATDGGLSSATLAAFNIDAALVVTTNPLNQSVAAGDTATFTAAASGSPSPTVQWEVSSDGGATFNPISGATSAIYSFTATADENSYQYEAVFTSAIGSATTAAATLTVQFAPIATTDPTNETVAEGNTATFTAAASGNPAATVQWEVSSDGGATFNPIGGATSAIYSFTATADENNDQYEAVFTNALGNAATTAATLTVQNAPAVTTNPTNQTVGAGVAATFTAAAGGNPAPTVQWEVSSDGGGTFTPINGATSTTYSFTAIAGQNNNQYEAVFTNSVGSATTTAATLTVQFVPNITTNPTDEAIGAGVTATFTAAAGGNPAPTVQWEVSSDNGATFSPIGGAISTSYSFTATAAENNNQYEAVFTNAAGSAKTTAATLTIVPTIGVWNSAVDAPWNADANWTDSQGAGVPGFSGVSGDQATFNGAAGLNVDLGVFNPNIATLTFGPAAPNYVILSSGGGVLQLNNGGGNATIGIAAGSQTIAAPVQLASNTTVLPAASTTLSVLGAVGSSAGTSLTLGDAANTGTLVASPAATVSIAAATNVFGGTLQVDGTWTTSALNITAAGGGQVAGQLAGRGTIDLTSGGLVYNSTANSTFAGTLTGSGSNAQLEVDSGRLNLTGTNGYTSNVVVQGGQLVVANPSALPDQSDLTVGSGTSAFGASMAASVAPAVIVTRSVSQAAEPVPRVRFGLVSSAASAAITQRFAPAVAWLAASANSVQWGPSQPKHASIQAIDTVLAEYGT